MILDVGCGSNPKGDVNIDLRSHVDPRKHLWLETKKIRNFVLSDACFLPFRDGLFDLVHSHHVIEHTETPALMLKEMVRVSKGKAILFCPHRFNIPSHRPWSKHHRHFFNKKWFANTLNQINRQFPINYIISVGYRGVPHPFLPLLSLPCEIRVEITKLNPELNDNDF